jgi:hypothetical protein
MAVAKKGQCRHGSLPAGSELAGRFAIASTYCRLTGNPLVASAQPQPIVQVPFQAPLALALSMSLALSPSFFTPL